MSRIDERLTPQEAAAWWRREAKKDAKNWRDDPAAAACSNVSHGKPGHCPMHIDQRFKKDRKRTFYLEGHCGLRGMT